MYAYGVSIAVTIFIGFHMIAVGILWIIAEMVVLPKERLLKLHIMMFRAIYTAQLREASHDWMRQEGDSSSGGQGGAAAAAAGTDEQQLPSAVAAAGATPARPDRISVQNFRSGLQRLVGSNGRRRRGTGERGRVQEVFGHPGNSLALPRYHHNRVTHVLMPPSHRHHQEDESNFGGGEGQGQGQGQEGHGTVLFISSVAELQDRDIARSVTANGQALDPIQAKDNNLMLANDGNITTTTTTTLSAAMESQQTGISEVHLHVTRRTSDQADRQLTDTQAPTGTGSRGSSEETVHYVLDARISP